MQTLILAGGFGTRISEESQYIPKPMIEIGGMPILWHIMKLYSSYGHNDFIILGGYKVNVIKEYFANYYLRRCNVTFDFSNYNKMTVHSNIAEPWRVTILDTGYSTMTGGRIKLASEYIDGDNFMLTYGDGVSTVDINALLSFHKNNDKLATLTAVQPEARYGNLRIDEKDMSITNFEEKAQQDTGWINGGFMVLNKKVLDYIDGENTIFERAPLERLAADGQLAAYKHHGFWQCMDTMRDKEKLTDLWDSGTAPWKRWND
ncbi:MAG: glucose-1-phosphate cytidylyltransferase [Clostridia bacterium]|nr:glucose-1-phosphate cytidylyltransferase [Clostridia bacterium]